MFVKSLGRWLALGGSVVLAAVALAAAGSAVSVGVGQAAPSGAAFFVTTGGAGSCAQNSPCQLQTALGLAGTGDSVYVAQGTFHGGGGAVVTLTHSIKLQGGWTGNPSGPPLIDLRTKPTTLDGEGSRRGVYVSAGLTPTIAGFVITHGNATGLFAGCLADSAKGCGGGMFVDHAAAVIEDNTFLNNIAVVTVTSYGQGLGGGLYLEIASGSVVSHNVFMSNTAALDEFHLQGSGGGLQVDDINTHTILVENNLFSGNLGATWGGGLSLKANGGPLVSCDVMVHGNTFQNNMAISGGGLYAWYCDAQIMNNTFRGNTGDAAAYLGHYAAPFAGNLLVGNPSDAGITVAYGDGGLASVYNNIVGQGGGLGMNVFAGTSDPVTLFAGHNTLVGPGSGTGLLVSTGDVTVTASNTLLAGFSTGIVSLHPVSVSVHADYTLFDPSVGGVGNANFTHLVFGAAAFVDGPGGDYHIQFTSAARDAGAGNFVSNDIDGDTRPIGNAPDIGADETRFVEATFLPLLRR